MPIVISRDTLDGLTAALRKHVALDELDVGLRERVVLQHASLIELYSRINGPDVEHIPFNKVVAMNESELRGLLRGRSVVAGSALAESVALVDRMHRAGKAVARVWVPDRAAATCFMIAPGLLLTNNHVLGSRPAAVGVEAHFGVDGKRAPGAGLPAEPKKFRLDPKRSFATNEDLDATVVAVAGAPEDEFGFIDLAEAVVPEAKRRAVIIQHPQGQPKQVAYGDNEIDAVEGDAVYYWTDTKPGSSGSPVFNEAMELIALHRETESALAKRVVGRNGKEDLYWRNRGVSILAVRAWLRGLGLLR